MAEENDPTDAERIALGLDPLQGEQLHDRGDLKRVLCRLGHDLDDGDPIPTDRWEAVSWTCPFDECDGKVEPVNTRVTGLPSSHEDFDESVSFDEWADHIRVEEARRSTVPAVVCIDCGSAWEASFRRLRDPDERSLPEPRIVETPGTLSGTPRIDGTRIGVKHVMAFYEQGHSPEEIALEVYPHLDEGHVRTAIEWAEANPETLAAVRRRDEAVRLRHDILQSAVDAAVGDCIDTLWSVLVNTKSSADRDVDPVRPVGSVLRNGVENAAGLDITIEVDEGRVIIDVADEVVARRNDGIDASGSNGEDEP